MAEELQTFSWGRPTVIRVKRGDHLENFLKISGFALLFCFISMSANAQRVCYAHDSSMLISCVANLDAFDKVALTQDISCFGGDCCGNTGRALINLNHRAHKVIDGQGFMITRYSQQKACPVIEMVNTSNISVQNLRLNENGGVPGCSIHDNCPATVEVHSSKSAKFQNFNVTHGKAYVVRVRITDGFLFENSSLADSGIIGLYVGDYDFGPSRNVIIRQSVFSATQANAISISGVLGNSLTDNQIVDNIFNRNHYNGHWIVPEGITNGGQIFLSTGHHMTVSGNIFADARCFNCVNQMVWGIELGEPAHYGKLSHIQISNNKFFNHYGLAFWMNDDSDVSSIQIFDNEIRGLLGIHRKLENAQMWNNVIGDSIQSVNFSGLQDGVIFRSRGARHFTRQWLVPDSIYEGSFVLSQYPRAGGQTTPLYHCTVRGDPEADFVSFDRGCEGQVLHSIYGYSYEPSYPGALPFYRCGLGNDHFISWSPDCEGGWNEGRLGYAVPR
jgi:hypothetical protein